MRGKRSYFLASVVMANKRSWLRISLRAFLLILTAAAVGIAIFANYANRRNAALAAIREAGGEVRFGIGTPSKLEEWFGEDLFGTVNKIDMREGQADNELMVKIGQIKEVGRLDLSSADIDDEGLKSIAHLPLSELWLQDTKITDASAATLSGMPTLRFLALNATSLSDQFLADLQPLPRLDDLGLRGTEVTGAGMKHLSRHAKLRKFDVYRTEVDDQGVSDLVGCQSLNRLGLSMTKVTDQVFEHLAKMPNLQDVDLSANRPVTTKAVLEFEKAYPKCDIEWYRK